MNEPSQLNIYLCLHSEDILHIYYQELLSSSFFCQQLLNYLSCSSVQFTDCHKKYNIHFITWMTFLPWDRNKFFSEWMSTYTKKLKIYYSEIINYKINFLIQKCNLIIISDKRADADHFSLVHYLYEKIEAFLVNQIWC